MSWKNIFIKIWIGQLFSILTSTMAQFAVVLWISLKTGSPEVLAWAAVAGFLPQIVIGPVAGVFVDRWKRKRTMIGADGFVALCSAVMAMLFYFDAMSLWCVYLLLMLRGIGGAFHAPAFKASVPLLAPEDQLTRIASINQSIQSVCLIAGPALGALLVVVFDMATVMWLDVLGAAIAIGTLSRVSIPDPVRAKSEEVGRSIRAVWEQMKEGVQVVVRHRGLAWLMLGEVLVAFFMMPVIVLLPLMTIQHFGGGSWEVGLSEALYGVGTLLGGALLGWWNPVRGRARLVVWSYVLVGALFAVSGWLPPTAFGIYVVLLLLQGIVVPFYTGPFTAILQTEVDPGVQGRVFSLFDSICLLPSVVGIVGAGVLAERWGVPLVFVWGGVASVLVGGVFFFVPSVRALDKKKADATASAPEIYSEK